ncbi:MAG TPA: hypothetical protein VNH11_11890 [Pirellulales bacterium]|nr:hypothetical protein [Pirellulales bacterium]
MSRPSATGICVLSIDVVSGDAGTADLCLRLAAADVPATWSIASSPCDELCAALRQQPGNEVALLAGGWAAEPSDRRTFSRSLTSSLADLRSAGYYPTTIALPIGRLATHDDLLAKHDICVARVSQRRQQPKARGWWPRLRSTPESTAVANLRWGLWEAAVTVDLRDAGLRGVAKTVDRLTGRGGSAIVVAPSDVLASDARATSKLIGHLARRREEQALRVTTLAGIAGDFRAARPATAARSILRPAA